MEASIMHLTLTDTALHWFETAYPLNQGESIRFFGKLYGNTAVHDGFSVGMKLDTPEKHIILADYTANGRTYFISQDDQWFFSRYHLEIDFDVTAESPIYNFSLAD